MFFFVLEERAHLTCLRFRQRITKKTCVFFCPARALDCCRFPEKTVYFRRKKLLSARFFSSPSLTFISNRSFFIIL